MLWRQQRARLRWRCSSSGTCNPDAAASGSDDEEEDNERDTFYEAPLPAEEDVARSLAAFFDAAAFDVDVPGEAYHDSDSDDPDPAALAIAPAAPAVAPSTP